MGNKWSGRRHHTTSAKESEGKTQTGWNNKTSTSWPEAVAVNNLSSSVSQAHAETRASDETEDQLTNNITIYRSYSNIAPPEAEAELRPCRLSSAGVRFES